MNVLLDAHALLWFIAGSASLSQTARTLIEDAANDKFISIASLWETAIKVGIGKCLSTRRSTRCFRIS